MAPKKPRNILFVNALPPGDAASAESQRNVHAHAAREAHASRVGRAKRFRIIEYQAGKPSPNPKDHAKVSRKLNRVEKSDPLSLDVVNPAKVPVPGPLDLLVSDPGDPFNSFARPLTKMERSLLDHFVYAVVPNFKIRCKYAWDVANYVDFMNKEWMRLIITKANSLDSTLLAACRHLADSLVHLHDLRQRYMQLALQYKLSCIRAVTEDISVDPSTLISDATITSVVMLAYDELLLGDMSTTRCHLQGSVQMVQHNGGPHRLGLGGFLENLVCKFWTELQIANPFEPATASLR